MRDQTLLRDKATLRHWFAMQDDAYLTRVLEACRDGSFSYMNTCKCVRGLCDGGYNGNKANTMKAYEAEFALACFTVKSHDNDELRRRIMPLVLAEIRRRTKRQQEAATVEVQVHG